MKDNERMSVEEYREKMGLPTLEELAASENSPNIILPEPAKKTKSAKSGKRKASKAPGVDQNGEPYFYDSKLEARYAETLAVRKLAGEIVEWYPQVVFPLLEKNEVPGERPVRYTADFVVVNSLPPQYEIKDNELYVDKKPLATGPFKMARLMSVKANCFEIHETKAAWLRSFRVDWPLRRKWFKYKYGLPVLEIIQQSNGDLIIK